MVRAGQLVRELSEIDLPEKTELVQYILKEHPVDQHHGPMKRSIEHENTRQ